MVMNAAAAMAARRRDRGDIRAVPRPLPAVAGHWRTIGGGDGRERPAGDCSGAVAAESGRRSRKTRWRCGGVRRRCAVATPVALALRCGNPFALRRGI